MRSVFVTLLALVATSCGTTSNSIPGELLGGPKYQVIAHTPPAIEVVAFALREHVDAFYEEAALHNVAVDVTTLKEIKFTSYPPGSWTAGHCQYEYGAVSKEPIRGTGSIYISEDIWFSLGFYSQRALIMHELAHCTLNRSHSHHDDQIMSATLPPEELLRDNWNSLVRGLFADTQSSLFLHSPSKDTPVNGPSSKRVFDTHEFID